MMDNESVRDTRNSSVVLLALLLAVAVVWAIAGTVMAAKRSRTLAESEKTAAADRQGRAATATVRTAPHSTTITQTAIITITTNSSNKRAK